MSRFDAKTNTFDQEGRLLQVEYALEAINNTPSVISIITQEGIIISNIKQNSSDQENKTEKIFKIHNHLYASMSGVTSDGNYLIGECRQMANQEELIYQQPIPIEKLVQQICNIKQYQTQTGGKRPYGVSLIVIGYDQYKQWQLFQTDPSGNYSGWKAVAIGKNNQVANQFLQKNYSENLTMDQGIKLIMQTLAKTAEVEKPNAQKLEVALIKQQRDQIKIKYLTEQEMETYINQI